ncbi:MAG: hypothetical protein ETSY2_40020 [Candidatus Entotheonella gemina]|uniref:Uncharacterized protein n=1 Tax=Candidatus Entotheonella gemina TaxID=1429439 RepID=W4LPC4_9BACT|nr:MAG: hypothetical protein ETSY2_40020 [Candidatus Entotheonella gemina]
MQDEATKRQAFVDTLQRLQECITRLLELLFTSLKRAA